MTSETNEFVRQLLNQMQEEMTKEYFKQESTTSPERLKVLEADAKMRLCTDLDKSSFMLDKYLRRKFDLDIYFDPYNRGTFSVPHGCTAVYDEDDPGHPYTVTAPDRTEQDKKINAMLQKHHCDPLDGFTVRFGE